MKLTYYGHSAFLLETASHRLLMDPFLSGNEKAAIKPEDVACDFILLTHGHNDHVGDTEAIAGANDATIIANAEIADYFDGKGLKTHAMYTGGQHAFPFGKVKFTIAHHGSSLATPEGRIAMGNPVGFLIMAEGKTLYNAGDTGLFLDMKLIGEQHYIDLALLPIGDNFTMGVDDAIEAVKFLGPKRVVPMHYDTWPLIAADTKVFAEGTARAGADPAILAPGESLEV
jgi:L-ascorbate metabolism protein UlaG (beta-lactamase superfamily)